jgi:hypothetical protein
MTQSSNKWVPGSLSLGVKRPGREDEFLPQSSAEVKNAEAIPPLPDIAFRVRCLINEAQGKFYLDFYLNMAAFSPPPESNGVAVHATDKE